MQLVCVGIWYTSLEWPAHTCMSVTMARGPLPHWSHLHSPSPNHPPPHFSFPPSLSLLCPLSVVISPGFGVTSISYRTWMNREARDPSLLVSCADGYLRLFRVLSETSVYLKRKFSVPQTTYPLRSAFCPLMSFLQVHDRWVWLESCDQGVIIN